jgi:hypothetical protein
VKLQDVNGVVVGKARRMLKNGDAESEQVVAILGSLDRRPMTAARAHALAARVWELAAGDAVPRHLAILVDCETHSASLDDEKVMLSQYLADLALALFALQARGTSIETIVSGKLGGGFYVALAAASHEVNLVYGSEIQLLPGKAIAAILGDGELPKPAFADYVNAGVAERELRIGLID